jgi:diguanylate cyclase (GGDEF)-like protein/PAS domain S-box-containing protein
MGVVGGGALSAARGWESPHRHTEGSCDAVACLTVDGHGRVLDAAGDTGVLTSMFGAVLPAGRRLAELVPVEQLATWWPRLRAARADDPRPVRHALWLRPAGRGIWVLTMATVQCDGPPDARRLLVHCSHVTEPPGPSVDLSGQILAAQGDLFERAFEDAATAMAVTSLEGRLLRVNDAFSDLLGLPAEETVGRPLLELTHPEDWPPGLDASAALIGGRSRRIRADRRYVRGDGRVVHTETAISLLTSAGDIPAALFVQLLDVTHRVQQADQLRHAAEHDALTGLANRTLVDRALRTALADVHQHGGCVGVLLIDLDAFKAVNDTHGHAVGDVLLAAVAGRLRGVVRSDDTAGRLGGDEFVVIARARTREQLDALARRVADVLTRPVVVEGRRIPVGASQGLAVLAATVSAVGRGRSLPPEPYAEQRLDRAAAELLAEADRRMYADKAARHLLDGMPSGA